MATGPRAWIGVGVIGAIGVALQAACTAYAPSEAAAVLAQIWAALHGDAQPQPPLFDLAPGSLALRMRVPLARPGSAPEFSRSSAREGHAFSYPSSGVDWVTFSSPVLALSPAGLPLYAHLRPPFAGSDVSRTPRPPQVELHVGQVVSRAGATGAARAYHAVVVGWDAVCTAPPEWVHARLHERPPHELGGSLDAPWYLLAVDERHAEAASADIVAAPRASVGGIGPHATGSRAPRRHASRGPAAAHAAAAKGSALAYVAASELEPFPVPAERRPPQVTHELLAHFFDFSEAVLSGPAGARAPSLVRVGMRALYRYVPAPWLRERYPDDT